jgi:hypothetical protein
MSNKRDKSNHQASKHQCPSQIQAQVHAVPSSATTTSQPKARESSYILELTRAEAAIKSVQEQPWIMGVKRATIKSQKESKQRTVAMFQWREVLTKRRANRLE